MFDTDYKDHLFDIDEEENTAVVRHVDGSVSEVDMEVEGYQQTTSFGDVILVSLFSQDIRVRPVEVHLPVKSRSAADNDEGVSEHEARRIFNVVRYARRVNGNEHKNELPYVQVWLDS